MKDNKKKLIILFSILGIVISLSFSIYMSLTMRNSENVSNINKDIPSDNGQVISTGEPKEPIILNPLDGKDDKPLIEGKETLRETEIAVKEKEVRELFRQFRFSEGTSLLEEINREENLTGDAEILQKLYYDGSLIMNLVPHDDDGDLSEETGEGIANDEGIVNVVKALQDPEDLLLAVLFLNDELREKIIVYKGSLNPIYKDIEEIRITQKTILSEIPNEIKIMYPEVIQIHEISFVLDGFILNGYIHEEKNGNLHFYSIEDPNNKSPYYTIEQWQKMRDNIAKGKPPMDGVLELKENLLSPEKTPENTTP